MSYSTESFAPAQDFATVVTDSDPAPLAGVVFRGTDNTEFVSVQANGAITAGQAVAIDAGQAVPLTAALAVTGVVIGVANVAFNDDDHGFIQTRGAVAAVDVLTSAAADVQLYATSTAGSLDDAGSVTLSGISLTAAESGGQAPAFIGAAITALSA